MTTTCLLFNKVKKMVSDCLHSISLNKPNKIGFSDFNERFDDENNSQYFIS